MLFPKFAPAFNPFRKLSPGVPGIGMFKAAYELTVIKFRKINIMVFIM